MYMLSIFWLNLNWQIHPRDDEISNGYGDVDNGGEKRADALLEGMINRPFQEIYLTRMVRSKVRIEPGV